MSDDHAVVGLGAGGGKMPGALMGGGQNSGDDPRPHLTPPPFENSKEAVASKTPAHSPLSSITNCDTMVVSVRNKGDTWTT